jgi:adenine-specific DNA-methyltransferase
VNSPEINAWLGTVVGKEAEDLSRHDKWLCMMYPRLRILKDLLSEDGSIFVSIDDNEVHNLIQAMNEIFGKSKFVANVIWQKRTSRENRSAIGDSHDFIVVYAASGRDSSKVVLKWALLLPMKERDPWIPSQRRNSGKCFSRRALASL